MISFTPIATVRNSRTTPEDDSWGNIISEIELNEFIPEESLKGIKDFSHLEIIFYFDKIDISKIKYEGHPRGNPAFPLTGIFAQRKKDRPNGIGITVVELLECKGKILKVKNLDAIDGTPVLDIKPVYKEFLPQTEIRQPKWVDELMKKYW